MFLGLFVLSFVVAGFLTCWLIDQLAKRMIVATTNERSMHKVPTPVGGGWAVLLVTLVGWMFFSWPLSNVTSWIVPLGVLGLALMSWVDDRQLVDPLLRFGVQIAAIVLVLATLPGERAVFWDGWPLWLDRFLTGLCWLWFVNLFNFMDGIDGIAGVEMLFVALGLVLVGLKIGTPFAELHILIVLAGASLGFLWWNWSPAHIFLGDVGAVPIGFLLGWFLIELAMRGHLLAALLLPAYFVADATVILLKRLARGEKVWKAHKTHYYQRAAARLGSHEEITKRIVVANIGLAAAALWSLKFPLTGAVGGGLVVYFILNDLRTIADKP
ncbi:MAG: glycosyltransferase family 4 protein [Hyphomicrobiaceae bacterium]|nr:glycosyltransferase family 4 protein [Hyphomicrobiaceae bacterium]